MKVIRHILITAAALILILGIPFSRTSCFAALLSGETDVVSSASVILDRPSGEYVVLINRDKHPDGEKLDTWRQFFAGEEIGFLFEDLKCLVATGDAGGQEMARSYQSRLPENQMTVDAMEAVLLFSRAEYGKFDVIVLSREFADAYAAGNLLAMDNIDVIEVKEAEQ